MITLTQNKVAFVCDCHYNLVKDYKWSAYRGKKGVFYAHASKRVEKRQPRSPNGVRVKRKYQNVKMHILINNTPKNMMTDHKDGNGLNNQCYNLRTVINAQNMQNGSKRVDNTTGHKGVYLYKKTGKYSAMVMMSGKQTYLGSFNTLEEAIEVRTRIAKQVYGKYYRE